MVGGAGPVRKTNFDITLLRTFVSIAEHGGFSEAAQALHLTQSAISHHIRRLEEQFEQPLFETHGRRKRLTEAGELFLWYAREILALNDEAFEKLGQRRDVRTTIRLGVAEYFAHDHLPVMLSSLRSEHAHINVNLQLGRSMVLQRMLSDGQLDVVIAIEPPGTLYTSEQKDIVVSDLRLTWLGARGYQIDCRKEVPLVVFAPPCILRDIQIERLKQDRRQWRIAYEARDLGDLLAAVRAGLGVSVLPFTPSRYGLTYPLSPQQFPVLPDICLSIKLGATVEVKQVRWLIELIRRCWPFPELNINASQGHAPLLS
ncbi:LysR family transcriptional regulator [Billgrantia sp. C5P2]|uniref:LysR family transcriptional regulator n=1 Tax=Billgrantia sp. C5P2 TaxID=3436239 RepID=UPI003DA5AAB7